MIRMIKETKVIYNGNFTPEEAIEVLKKLFDNKDFRFTEIHIDQSSLSVTYTEEIEI